MGGLILKLRIWWESADKNQRLISIGGAAFLALLLAGVFVFATKPKMSVAFYGLSPEDMGMVVQEIQTMGMPVEYDSSGNVSIPEGKIPEVRVALVNKGKLPKSNSHMSKRDFSNTMIIMMQRII